MQIDMKMNQVKPTFSVLYLWNREHGIDFFVIFTNSNLTCSSFLFRVCYFLKSLESPDIKF